MATHSSIPAWENPWTEESGRLQVAKNWTGLEQLSMHTCCITAVRQKKTGIIKEKSIIQYEHAN